MNMYVLYLRVSIVSWVCTITSPLIDKRRSSRDDVKTATGISSDISLMESAWFTRSFLVIARGLLHHWSRVGSRESNNKCIQEVLFYLWHKTRSHLLQLELKIVHFNQPPPLSLSFRGNCTWLNMSSSWTWNVLSRNISWVIPTYTLARLAT